VTPPPLEPPIPDSEADLERRLARLSQLLEVARALIGAPDARAAAARLCYSAMGVLGARSATLFAAEGHGRYVVRHSSLAEVAPGEAIRLGESAREWMLREGAFALSSPGAPRALGDARERLARRDAALGMAVADGEGLLALLVLGPRVVGEGYGPEDVAQLEALATLAAPALAVRDREPRGAPRSRSEPPAGAKGASGLEALRRRHPALRALVGTSEPIREASHDLVAAADLRFPVLITGESGVGKEVAARTLHALSPRATGPFEVVDCGSIPAELIESELFGHVRGAFTGAHRDRRGAFEIAHRGTLFLDEIGDMPLQLQTRLLRVLQEGHIRRVGDEDRIEVDVRVVAATHRDLIAAVAAQRFREDLYYRLNVFNIHLPPLRERPGDLPLLIGHFLARGAHELGTDGWTVERDVLDALETHPFPGNLRELSNLCAALTARARGGGHITLEHLEQVWRRQRGGEPPWRDEAHAASGHLGAWVLGQLRATRFNLIAAERELRRKRKGGRATPLGERSALAYYLNGEILRALVEADGDRKAAARALAGDAELAERVAPRVDKVCEVLRAAGANRARLEKTFAKLPAEYTGLLEPAARCVARHAPAS
jgi:DNA-binding NtrC family response regulator